jgi:hypothetical protein
MVDGRDCNDTVKIKAWLDSPTRSAFDFGFVDDGLYVSIMNRNRTMGAYVFSGSAIADFALRNSGTDRLFGTFDDLIYRLSDRAGYARQHYFAPIKHRSPVKPGNMPNSFQDLRLNWDLDLDRRLDAHTLIEFKGSRFDGMLPVPAAVPGPAAMWLFGSGLMGLAFMGRIAGRSARQRSGIAGPAEAGYV